MGLERLVLMLQETGADLTSQAPAVYAVAVGDAAQRTALSTVENLRNEFPGQQIVLHTGGGSFRSQMKKADKSGALVALIWGEDEVNAAQVTVKPLRDQQATQQSVAVSEVHTTLTTILGS